MATVSERVIDIVAKQLGVSKDQDYARNLLRERSGRRFARSGRIGDGTRRRVRHQYSRRCRGENSNRRSGHRVHRKDAVVSRAAMKRRVVVTGLGAVTSLSRKVEDLWQRILRGESGIHPLTLFDTEQFKVKFGGDIYDWSPGEEYVSAKEQKRSIASRNSPWSPASTPCAKAGSISPRKIRFAAASSLAPASAACTRSKSNWPDCCTKAPTRSRPLRFPS